MVRRADNDMVNGTKLLNVTKMTRGRRDGILKAEKNQACGEDWFHAFEGCLDTV